MATAKKPATKAKPKSKAVARKPKAEPKVIEGIEFLVGNNEKKRVGRPRQLKYPEDLWKLFLEYKQFCADNPRVTYTASLGKLVKVPHEKPLTIEGFEMFAHTKGVSVYNYLENKNGAYEEFYHVTLYIRAHIRGEQIEGALIGVYNGNIVARVNHLAERNENINTNVEVPLFPDVQADDSN